MPTYYRPSLAGDIPPGTRETRATGAGEKVKNGQFVPRDELHTDNGRTVETTTVTLTTGETTRRVSVWAVYDRGGRRIGQFPHNRRADAVAPAGGWVQRETVNG